MDQRNISTSQTDKVLIIRTELFDPVRDRHMVDAAWALKSKHYDVTLATTAISKDMLGAVQSLRLVQHGDLLPRTIFGLLAGVMYVFRSVYLAVFMSLFPPKPQPHVVLCDCASLAVPILKNLGGYRVVFFKHFYELMREDVVFSRPPELSVKCIAQADVVVVQNDCLADVFRRKYNAVKTMPTICRPCMVRLLSIKGDRVPFCMLTPNVPMDVFLFLAFVEYQQKYNFDLALSAFEILWNNLPERYMNRVHLLFTSSSLEMTSKEKAFHKALTSKVSKMLIAPYVSFLNVTSEEHRASLLANCFTLLHTRENDVFALPVLEAMHYGKPVVSVNSGLPREIIVHKLSGFLSEACPWKYSECMLELLENEFNAEAIGQMGRNIFQEKFSFRTYRQNLDKMMKEQSAKHLVKPRCNLMRALIKTS